MIRSKIAGFRNFVVRSKGPDGIKTVKSAYPVAVGGVSGQSRSVQKVREFLVAAHGTRRRHTVAGNDPRLEVGVYEIWRSQQDFPIAAAYVFAVSGESGLPPMAESTRKAAAISDCHDATQMWIRLLEIKRSMLHDEGIRWPE